MNNSLSFCRISTFDTHAIKAPEEGGQKKENEKGNTAGSNSAGNSIHEQSIIC